MAAFSPVASSAMLTAYILLYLTIYKNKKYKFTNFPLTKFQTRGLRARKGATEGPTIQRISLLKPPKTLAVAINCVRVERLRRILVARRGDANYDPLPPTSPSLAFLRVEART